jgi:hypothetical protein
MGYAVLWLENLAVVLLLTATAVALSSRWKWTVLRLGLPLLVALLILAGHAGCTVLVAWLWPKRLGSEWLCPLAAITLCSAIGIGWILLVGLRRGREDRSRPRAAHWPRARLASGFALVLAMYLMTFWNLDLAVRHQVSALHAESGALALSVAPARVPDRDNAAVVYAQALQAVGAPATWPKAFYEKWGKWVDPGQPGFDPQDTELRAFLKQQAGTLALLREAGQKPACYFDRDYGRPAVDMLLPELYGLRAGAHLLALDARVKAADHELRSALRDCRAILAMSEHVASDPFLVPVLYSIVIQDTATATLEAVLNSAPVAAEDLAEVDVGENLSYHRVFLRALRMEEASQLRTIYDLASGRLSLGVLMALVDRPRPAPADWFTPVYRLFLLDEDLDAQRAVIATCRQLAAKPYYEAKPGWDEFEHRLTTVTRGLVTRLLVPPIAYGAQTAARGEAQHDVLRLAVAGCRFRARHNRLPGDLAELAPEFIPAVPRDPFDGRPLRMKKSAGKLIMYSIGPDMVDNSGALFDSNKKTGDIPFTLREQPAPKPGR